MATRYEPKAKYQFGDRVFFVDFDNKLSRNKIAQVYVEKHGSDFYKVRHRANFGTLRRMPESAFFLMGEEIKVPFVHKNGKINFYSVPGLVMTKTLEQVLRRGGEVTIDGKRAVCKESEFPIAIT